MAKKKVSFYAKTKKGKRVKVSFYTRTPRKPAPKKKRKK